MQDLDTRLRELLEARRGDWSRIAERADISYSWISKFMNGHIPNPGFATMKELHALLLAEDKDEKAGAK